MRLVLRCLVFVLAIPTFAAAQTDSSTESTQKFPNLMDAVQIHQGNWQISGEGEYFRSNTGDEKTITLNPRLEYFFLNRFSAGGTILFSDGNIRPATLSFGPSLTYYFALIEKAALKVRQSVLWVNPPGAADNYFAGETGAGVDFFLSPHVAVGPSLNALYYFSGDTAKPEGGLAFRVGLSVFM